MFTPRASAATSSGRSYSRSMRSRTRRSSTRSPRSGAAAGLLVTATILPRPSARTSGERIELPGQEGHVGIHQAGDELLEADGRLPAETLAGLRGVADQQVDLGGPEVALVDPDVLLPVQPDVRERDLAELLHRVGLAGGDHVVVGLVLLQHQPHGAHVVRGVAPVAPGMEVPDADLALPAELDASDGVAD